MKTARLSACTVLAGLAIVDTCFGKVYFQETFDTEKWRDRWEVPTEWKPKSDIGVWGWTAGKYHGKSGEDDKGIQTSEDNRFYGLSAKLDEAFTNQDKDLVLQFAVKNEQKRFDCGGAYIKLLGDIDQSSFGGDSPYQIMFGPDICGPTNARTHVIFNYPPKDTNLLIKEDVKVEKDDLTHIYTLHVKKDGSYEVFIDQQSQRSGKLEDDWDFLPAKTIKDPEQSKPQDWVDQKMIPDPEATKPEGYDDIPKEIPDPEASKPADWDEESDGEWEPPMIDNPEYKGPWKPKMIKNPDYKGPWEHPEIANPEYKEDPELYKRCNKCTHIGFELWQVTAGTIFDDIIVTDSLEEAQAFAEKHSLPKRDGEKEMRDKQKEAEREARAAKQDDELEIDDEAFDMDMMAGMDGMDGITIDTATMEASAGKVDDEDDEDEDHEEL